MSTQVSKDRQKPIDQLQAGIEAALQRAARKAQALERQYQQDTCAAGQPVNESKGAAEKK